MPQNNILDYTKHSFFIRLYFKLLLLFVQVYNSDQLSAVTRKCELTLVMIISPFALSLHVPLKTR